MNRYLGQRTGRLGKDSDFHSLMDRRDWLWGTHGHTCFGGPVKQLPDRMSKEKGIKTCVLGGSSLELWNPYLESEGKQRREQLGSWLGNPEGDGDAVPGFRIYSPLALRVQLMALSFII